MKPIETTLIWRFMEKLMRWILILCSGLLVIVIGIAVFMRYVMNSVFFGSDEILALLAIWLYWIGGAYGSYEDSHISADMSSLFIKNPKVLHVFQTAVRGITVVISGIFAYWSVANYLIRNITHPTTTTGLRIPHLTSKIALTIGFCLMFLYSFYHFIRALRPRTDLEGSDLESAEEGGTA